MDIKERYLVYQGSIAERYLPAGVKDISYEQLNTLAHKVLPQRARDLSKLLDRGIRITTQSGEIVSNPFYFKRVAIKNNISNWGSCSSLRNINLNMHLVRIPIPLMNFVIAHELCHLVYPNHGKKFHSLLNLITEGKERYLSRSLDRIKLFL